MHALPACRTCLDLHASIRMHLRLHSCCLTLKINRKLCKPTIQIDLDAIIRQGHVLMCRQAWLSLLTTGWNCCAVRCVGSHMFSIVFSGGTYSNSASCADVLGFGLPSNSLKVSVVNCTDTSATGNLPGSTAAAAAGDAATTAEGVDISPVTLSRTVCLPLAVACSRGMMYQYVQY